MGQKFHLWNFRNPSAGMVCLLLCLPISWLHNNPGYVHQCCCFFLYYHPFFLLFCWDLAILVPFRFVFQTSSCWCCYHAHCNQCKSVYCFFSQYLRTKYVFWCFTIVVVLNWLNVLYVYCWQLRTYILQWHRTMMRMAELMLACEHFSLEPPLS